MYYYDFHVKLILIKLKITFHNPHNNIILKYLMIHIDLFQQYVQIRSSLDTNPTPATRSFPQPQPINLTLRTTMPRRGSVRSYILWLISSVWMMSWRRNSQQVSSGFQAVSQHLFFNNYKNQLFYKICNFVLRFFLKTFPKYVMIKIKLFAINFLIFLKNCSNKQINDMSILLKEFWFYGKHFGVFLHTR